MSISAEHALHTNRLIDATSPYLLQHAHNPVDWYPWGPEALEKARAEDKPIFLSIGYSACHWCHVMERESFENEQIAEILNREYVSIKVDREERPDLDEIYMTATVLYNQGQGGWPMSVFLTPQGKPFYAGTYFPPDSRWGRPGFKDVLIQVARLWREQRQRLVESADTLTAAIRTYGGPSADANGIPHDLVSVTARSLAQAFDPLEGGTLSGQTNKFPPSMAMTLMLREYHRTRSSGQPDQILLDRVQTTLDKMAAGGIYDHLGGGIARYSTDPQWLVPHFEKMLYDQALVSAVYIEAWQVTGREQYAEVAQDIFDYVLADLQSLEGGFFSSRDADSEGVEGKYYVWSKSEITNVLGERAGEMFCSYYDVTEEGNWEGRNILHVPRSLGTVAKLNRIDPAELKRILDDSRGKLRGIRAQRVPPGLDDKILTSWNGLMIASLAHGGRALGERRYVDAAARAAEFVLTRMTADGRLLRTCRSGKAHTPGYLDDYAFFVEALLELYFATFEPQWLLEAVRLNAETLAHFWDNADGAFFLTADDAEPLVVRSKDIQDGATPAGNSVALLNLVRLAEILDSTELRDRAVRAMQALGGSVRQSPAAFTRLLLAVDLACATGGLSAGEDTSSRATGGLSASEDTSRQAARGTNACGWRQERQGSCATGGLSASAKTRADQLPVAHAHLPATQVVIVGPLGDPATQGLIQTASQGYDPYRMTFLADATVPDADALRQRVPLLEGKILVQGRPAAYVCRDRTCGKPARSPEELRDALSIKG